MKRFKLLIAPLLALPFVVSCGGGSEEYTVSISNTDVAMVYPKQVIKGEKYVGTIEIVDPATKQTLPDKLTKVTSGNKTLSSTEYTYKPEGSKTTAAFTIPAENVLGNIVIELDIDK